MKPKTKKPGKPNKDFPLTAHPGGSWCKKIGGKLKYFGPWNDPKGAEARYLEFEHSQRTGMGERHLNDGRGSLHSLTNPFLTHHNDRAITGDINVRSFRDLKKTIQDFVTVVGRETRISDIRPEHFALFRHSLLKRELGGPAMNRTITLVKQLFHYAYDENHIDKPMRYGQSFEKIPQSTIRKARVEKEFTGAEMRRMLECSGGPLKAFVLLAINCGFGNNDIGALNESDVDLKEGWISYARTKTGEKRRCPLWPETIKAMKATIVDRRKPATAADVGAFFITRFGRRFVRAENRIENEVIVGQSVVDSVSTLFWKMMIGAELWAGNKSDGRNFYTIRRTHRTLADECNDQHAAALIMGHGTGTIARLYVQRITDERLLAVSKHIRSKIIK